MTREERIEAAKQYAPLDRRQIAEEIRELEMQSKLHPENAVLCYRRTDVLLEQLAELDADESPQAIHDTGDVGTTEEYTGQEPSDT